MKTKKDKLSRQIQKPHHSLSEELESNELIIDLKSYVNDLNSNNDVHYFNVQVMHNRRSIDKQAVELAKNLIIEEPPFFDTPEPLPKTSASSESGKIEILLGVAFDKLLESIDFLRIEEVEVYDESILNSCFSISSKYRTISKLHLIDCCLNAKSIGIIAKQLRAENNTIKDLSLDMNVVPEQNYHCLIDGTTLEHISLKNCKINCKGAKLISQALEYNKPENKQNLLSLVLNGNAIEDCGLLFIAMALRTNFKLHYLSLANNLITDSGIEMIAGILKNFPISPEEDRRRRFMFIKYLESATNQYGKECIDPICNTVERFSVSNQQRKSSLSNDRPSTRTSNDETRNPEDIISNISNSILSATNIINGDLHPLLTTVYKDGNLKYCVGNFALAYLNLSYNYFGKIGMHALIEAAKYQSSVGSQVNGLGLMGVKAEGLKRKENVDEEIEELNKILRNRSLPKLYDRRHLISYITL
ncbi:hypothetical protein LSTR_LSTR010514 [Laodelphax striatellus]|uniref:Leucine-rich repeat-containing protein 71 n=1 Tax=Laodelphax striatellus TaxID=195883 RepID=A0A482X2Q4_LAOST|nr:hypothetical protein LSTR_LSTR010514 [Laodelphax striatellus]